mgnify:CR=1 FL=1
MLIMQNQVIEERREDTEIKNQLKFPVRVILDQYKLPVQVASINLKTVN